MIMTIMITTNIVIPTVSTMLKLIIVFIAMMIAIKILIN